MRAAAKLTVAAVLALGAWLAPAAPALAATTPAAGWTIGSFAAPTDFSATNNAACLATLTRCDRYVITATDAGSAATDGSEVTLADDLPAGLVAQHVELFWSGFEGGSGGLADLASRFGLCTTAPVRCSIPASFFQTYGDVQSDAQLEMVIYVTVEEPASQGPLTNAATISGGGADEATTSRQNAISPELAVFGLADFNAYLAGFDGAPDVQAGSHPYELTTTIDLANAFNLLYADQGSTTSVADLKDAIVDLPVGLLGGATATPTCTLAELASTEGCPANTQVGHISSQPPSEESVDGPIYNVAPEHGVAAEFGYVDSLHGAHLMYASVVPAPEGYVLQVSSREIPQIQLTDIVATFYGDPAQHDGDGDEQVAMLTNPADCSGEPLTTSIHIDSWQQPGSFGAGGMPNLGESSWASSASSSPPVIGCDQLQFHPTATVAPSTSHAASPTGLSVTLHVPQSNDPSALATPPLKTAVVTLPQGVSLNPASAGGLSGCTLEELGMSASGEPNAAAPQCPESSQIGTVEVESPLLSTTLQGSVYLASPYENPFDSLVAMYIVVDDPTTGIVLKLPGDVTLNQSTGQITTSFTDQPQMPFSELTLHLKQGERAPLSTPSACGAYSASTELTPWSAPQSGPPVTESQPFAITSNCMSGFAPSFSAGTTDNQAGGFSPFTMALTRHDSEQALGSVSMTMPPGLTAMLSNVPLCGEPRADEGNCSAASQIGHVSVQAGVGGHPVELPESGRREDPVYLTGPYEGAPFGLAIVVHPEAGPFNLAEGAGTASEKPVVVRAKIEVEPTSAQVSIRTDATGPHAMPTMLQGIPVDLKAIDVTINREGFMFNPTNCERLSLSGTIGGAEGASANVSSRFQAADCGSLAFKPTFTVSTSGKTSKREGASLRTRIAFPSGSLGKQANIREVRVVLPKALPSRLEPTLSHACLAKQFAANPAGCPADSLIGTAKADTPILPVPLEGPAYFVSNGGAKWPEIALVLQGDGVTIDLFGETHISKSAITTSTFRTVPDAPVSSFELNLPEGPHSALAANGNLCQKALQMPTLMVGQNGVQFEQDTLIAVEGCSKKISIDSHRLKGKTMILKITVPSAGTLAAAGKSLTKASKKAKGRETLTLELMARGPRHAAKVKVSITFKPSRGKGTQHQTLVLKAG